MSTNITTVIPKFAQTVVLRAEAILKLHQTPPDPITVQALDTLIADALELSQTVEHLAELTKTLNKAIMSLESKAGGYLRALDRTDYVCPLGLIEIKGKWRVSLPRTDEDKLALFSHLKERGIFEKFATVNANSLNSLFMADWEAAKKKDPTAAVTFSMPGVPEPKFDEFTQIKPKKGLKKKEEVENE